jgi:hypothetical protein
LRHKYTTEKIKSNFITMGRPKISDSKGKQKARVYDYPQQREIGKYLSAKDKVLIASLTNLSSQYVRQWCRGKRRNKRIEEWALKISKLNQAKEKKILKKECNSSKQ